MTTTHKMLERLVETKIKIDAWKAAHPNESEIIDLVQEYVELFDMIYRQCSPPTVIDYPPLWSVPHFICASQTVTQTCQYTSCDTNPTQVTFL